MTTLVNDTEHKQEELGEMNVHVETHIHINNHNGNSDSQPSKEYNDHKHNGTKLRFSRPMPGLLLASDSESEDVNVNNFSLTDYLWAECLKLELPQKSLQSKFIQGIKNGDLSPNVYGAYMVQDVGYCVRLTENWFTAAMRAQKCGNQQAMYEFCNLNFTKMNKFIRTFNRQWHIKYDCVDFGAAIQQYLDYQKYVTEEMDLCYTLPAIFACYYLWPWICKEIEPFMIDAHENVYREWYENHRSGRSAKRIAAKIDELYMQSVIDKSQALNVLITCLKGEANFFLAACNEELIPIVDEYVVIWAEITDNDDDDDDDDRSNNNPIKTGKFQCEDKRQALQIYNSIINSKSSNFRCKIFIENYKLRLRLELQITESINSSKIVYHALIGKAVVESHLKLDDSANQSYMYYVLWFENQPQMLATNIPAQANKEYARMNLTLAKVMIQVSTGIDIKITRSQGSEYYKHICVGYWWTQSRDT